MIAFVRGITSRDERRKPSVALGTLLGVLMPILAVGQTPFYHTATPLRQGRQMYGSAVVGDFLYILGGNLQPDEFTNSVDMAPIQPDGSLGPWTSTTELPTNRSYISNTTLALGGTIYIVQGSNEITMEKVRTVLWSRPGPDGHLAPWQESVPCPSAGVSCSVAVASLGYIHLLGGSIGGSIPTSEVWSAKLGPDGAVLAWEPGPPLPSPLWFHSAGLVDGKVFVYGGLFASGAGDVSPEVYLSPLQSTGQLGPWQTLPVKPDRGFYSSACTVAGNFLISFCPRYTGGVHSGDVWFAAVGPQGLSPWTCVPAEIPTKLYIGVASDPRRGIVYIPGGRLNKGEASFDPTVYSFALAAPGSGQAAAPPQTQPQPQVQAAAYPQPNRTAAQPGMAAAYPGTAQPGAIPAGYAPGGGIGNGSPGGGIGNGAPGAAAMPAGPAALNPAPPRVASLPPEFLTYESAKQLYARQPKPSVLYFHTKQDPTCLQQSAVLAALPPGVLPSTVIFAEIDAQIAPQSAQQLGVTRVPCWIFYTAQGVQATRVEGTLTLDQLVQGLAKIAR